MHFNLTLQDQTSPTIQALSLSAKLQLYEGNILRMTVGEQTGVSHNRFKVSSIPDFAVMDDQLTLVKPKVILQTENDITFTADDQSVFRLQFEPFRIENYVDGKLVVTVNDQDTLYFEANTGKNEDQCATTSFFEFWPFKTTSYPNYNTQIDYQLAVGLGAKFETSYLYGLSERESSLLL